MKRILTLCTLSLLSWATVVAQEYFTGQMTTAAGVESAIFYDRTQINISAYVFQTVYKVLDKKKTEIYTATITHDQLKSIIYVALKADGGNAKGFAITYHPEQSGLIFSELSHTDADYPIDYPYRYLISFTGTPREFPMLHKIKTAQNTELSLDPLSHIRLKMHSELVRKIAGAEGEQAAAEETRQGFDNLGGKGTFEDKLNSERLALLRLKDEYADSIATFRAALADEIARRFTTNKVAAGEVKYDGEQERGKPQGRGLMATEGNVYSGRFERGKLKDGVALLQTDSAEYLGHYAYPLGYQGFGWLSYTSGSYRLGQFEHGILVNGIELIKEQSGAVFFGSVTSMQRTGYGELRSATGSLYFGEFAAGRLVRGYAKEIDQFGYAAYSKIENGKKIPVELQAAESFFGLVLYTKK